MNDRTKQRVFWIVAVSIIACAIFAFSYLSVQASKPINKAITQTYSGEQQEEAAQASDIGSIFRGRFPVLVRAFLFVLLSFGLYFVFDGARGRIILAGGTAFLLALLEELFQRISGCHPSWREALLKLGCVPLGIGAALLVLFLIEKSRKWFNRHKDNRRLETVLDALSLAAVLQYAVYRFLQSTMFRLYYSNRYKMLTMLLLIVFGGIRFLYLVLKKCRAVGNRKEQSFFMLRCALAFCIAIPFVLVGWMHDYKALIFLPICCMCLYDMAPEKVCRAFFVVIGTCLVALILCCLSGTVRNLVDPYNHSIGGFGTINTTDFASYFSFLLLIKWCGMRSHRWYAGLLFAAGAATVTYLVYSVTGSRTALYNGGLTVFFVLWDSLEENVFRRLKGLRLFGKTVNWLSVLAFPVIGALVVYLTACYAARDSWAVQLNTALSGRLGTVLTPFRTYGIKAFGNTIETMHGQGGTVLGQFWSTGYSYLDIAYAMLAIRYGWVLAGVFTALWIWMTVKALKCGKNRFAFALVVLAAHAFSEARILDVNYNIFIIMPFCAFTLKEQKQQNAIIQDKKIGPSLLTGLAIGGIVYLILPRVLSWLRTFFYIKSWNTGTSAFASFLFSIGLIVLLWLLWKTVSHYFDKQNIKRLIPVLGIVILLGGSVFIVNHTIEYGRKTQADRLNAEKQVIRQIQDAATMPVYAAESEELYRRDGIALADHLFSTEELGRSRGSILVDSGIDSLAIIRAGGQYTQISEKTGLYSFDPAVVDALTNAGYEWTKSYTGIRHCNLRDMALFNDIKAGDQLALSGSTRITTVNMKTDQLWGEYQVRFALSNLSASEEGDAVLLEVIGENDDRTLLQKMLTTDDFDSEGRCDYTLTYQINPTPGVYYAITAMKEVSVAIDDISWWRVAQKNENLLHNTVLIGTHESSGVTYAANPDGSVSIKGEATNISFYNIFINKTSLPYWLQKGKEYLIQINDPTGMVSFEVYIYDADQKILSPALVSTKESQVFSLPDEASGIIIRFRAWKGKPIDTTVIPVICEY